MLITIREKSDEVASNENTFSTQYPITLSAEKFLKWLRKNLYKVINVFNGDAIIIDKKEIAEMVAREKGNA